jgi:hypothetical protein
MPLHILLRVILAFIFVSLNKLPWNLLAYDTNTLKTKRRLLYLMTQLVPRSKHFSSRL